ncbi:MAG: putative exported protein [Rhodoferax sp.]|nr:putative exported protein [Rhodoferax sp.]
MLDDTDAAPGAGHNVTAEPLAADRLRSLVERIERLLEERKALSSDISDIYKESASAGFENKVIRQLIRIRAQDPAEVEEQEMLLDTYRRALGM